MQGWYKQKAFKCGLLISFLTELHACSFEISRTWNEISFREKENKKFSETKQRKWNLILIYFMARACMLLFVDFQGWLLWPTFIAKIVAWLSKLIKRPFLNRLIRFSALTISTFYRWRRDSTESVFVTTKFLRSQISLI